MSDFELPDRGIVFWAVGVGDSTTVVIGEDAILQIDLHHLEAAEDDDDPRVPIVDRLVGLLPERDGEPYLAAFAATHLDKDHILGFAELLDRVTIGDLWFTPKIFRDVDEGELCDDGKVARESGKRKVAGFRWACDSGCVTPSPASPTPPGTPIRGRGASTWMPVLAASSILTRSAFWGAPGCAFSGAVGRTKSPYGGSKS